MKFHSSFFIFILVICCSLRVQAQVEQKDNSTGFLYTMQSEFMGDERTFEVYLPERYATSEQDYPVLYILDGQRYFLHGVSLQKSFIDFEQTPEFIIVGISKQATDRNSNYNSNAKNYLNFLKNEVIEFIDSTYRTSAVRMLFGWAQGGGFTLETMTLEPELFEVYIAASPFPVEHHLAGIDSLLSANLNFNKQLFFTSGSKEGVVKEATYKLNALLTHKAPATMPWKFRELLGEEHRSTPFTTLYHGFGVF